MTRGAKDLFRSRRDALATAGVLHGSFAGFAYLAVEKEFPPRIRVRGDKVVSFRFPVENRRHQLAPTENPLQIISFGPRKSLPHKKLFSHGATRITKRGTPEYDPFSSLWLRALVRVDCVPAAGRAGPSGEIGGPN